MLVTFGIGANLGDRLAHLVAAVATLESVCLRDRPGEPALQLSPVVETEPVGGPPQPEYLNAVVRGRLPEDVDLWQLADSIEQSRGRERGVRFGPRTLDVDVLTADDIVSHSPTLTLPHPRAHERAFVLVPWADLDPEAVIPGHGKVTALRDALPAAARAAVRHRPDLRLR